MLCTDCGMVNSQEHRFCSNCGKALDAKKSTESRTISFVKNPPSENQQKIIIGAIAAVVVICGCVAVSIAGWFYGDDALRYVSTFTTGQKTVTRTPTRRPTSQATTSSTTIDPTPTIAPTSSASKQWKAAQVINAFKTAGLEITNPRTMTADDYGTVPKVATEAYRFFQPSLGGNKGGRIYVFSTSQDLETVRQFYESPQNKAAIPPWIYVRDNILVQINGEYAESRAKKYEDALNAMK